MADVDTTGYLYIEAFDPVVMIALSNAENCILQFAIVSEGAYGSVTPGYPDRSSPPPHSQPKP